MYVKDIKDVVRFIENFKKLHPKETEDIFLNGNCYWFARILEERFNGRILYQPVENHFVTKICGKYFDIRGEIVPSKPIMSWKLYQKVEPLDASRVRRYCINQIE